MPVSNDISIIDFIIGDVLLPFKSLVISTSDNLLSLGSAFLGRLIDKIGFSTG